VVRKGYRHECPDDRRSSSPKGDFVVASTSLDGAVHVSIRGELDICTGPVLRARLLEVLDTTGGDIIVDLAPLAFTDAAGMHVLLDTADLCAARGRAVRYRGAHGVVARVATILEAADRFGVTDGDAAGPRAHPPSAS
jgi:anti-anti-sigma factor